MSQVYMNCGWLIFDGFDLDETLRLSHVLECEIRFREIKGGVIYDNGYLLLPVVISSVAEEIIKIYCETVHPSARFVQCQLTSLTDFQEGWAGFGVPRERSIQLMERWCVHNKRIEKGYPFWTQASWHAKPITLNALHEAITLAETSGIAIFYRDIDNGSPYFNFYFKVFSYHQFDMRLEEIGRILQLEAWHIKRSTLIVEPENNPDFAGLEASQPLTRKTIPEFLEILNGYL